MKEKGNLLIWRLPFVLFVFDFPNSLQDLLLCGDRIRDRQSRHACQWVGNAERFIF